MEVFELKTSDKFLSFEFDFYKTLYEDGLKQREHLEGKFVPTITLLSAEIAGVIWMFPHFRNDCARISNLIYTKGFCRLLSPAFTILFLLLAIIYFILCFTKYNFYFPNPAKTKTLIDDSITALDSFDEKTVYDNMITLIADSYANISIDNCIEINKHSDYLNKCYWCMILSFTFLCISYIMYLFL